MPEPAARPERDATAVAAVRTVATQRLGGLDRSALEARLSTSPLAAQAQAQSLQPGQSSDLPLRTPPGSAVQVEGRLRDTASREVTQNNDGTATLSLGRVSQRELQVGVDVGPAGVTAGVSAGNQAAYEFTGPPGTVQSVADGRTPQPDIFSPESLPVGTSLTVRAEQNQGNTLGAAFRNMGLEFGDTRSNGLAFQVERRDENTVRLTAGQLAGREQSVQAGVSVRDQDVGIRAGGTFNTNDSRSVDLDISTPEGRAAYREFTATGRLPQPGTPGVTAAGATTTVDVNTSLGLVAGPLEATAAERGVRIQGTTQPDGSTDRTLTVREGELATTARIQQSPGGDPTFTTQVALQASATQADAFMRAAGLPRRTTLATDGTRVLEHPRLDMSLNLDASRMMALRDQARQAIPDHARLGPTDHGQHLALRIAQANTPAEVQAALAGGMHMPPIRNTADGLLGMAQFLSGRTGRPVDLGLTFTPAR